VLRFALLFALGVLGFHRLPWLPAWGWLVAGVLLLALLCARRPARPLAPLLTGLVWSHLYALLSLPPALPGEDAVMRLVVTGEVASLTASADNPARFVMDVDTVEGAGGAPLKGVWRLRLSWYDAPGLRSGERWRLAVRLRTAHGYASPGAWDYEGWLYWEGIRYTGYVSADAPAVRLAEAACCWLTRVRSDLSAAIAAQPASEFARGVIRAITVGDGAGLSEEARALLRATGTSHLMAISGLHIGLVAGLGLVGIAWLWRRIPPLCARVPARIAGAWFGLGAAACYAALAGMGLPTQRALIMLTMFAIALVLRRQGSTPHALAAALLGVLLWHPPSILSAGFWLSFGAVLVILAALRLDPQRPAWRKAVRVQFALSLALWPVLAAFGMPASSAAPLANLALVPLFGVLIVPLSLLGVVLLGLDAPAGGWLLAQLGWLLDWVESALGLIVALPWPQLGAHAASPALLACCAVAAALLLAPPGFPLRRLAVPLFALVWLPAQPRVGEGDFALFVLDVGQGLSSVVQTRHHTLIFDTGPEFPSGFSTAQAVVLPFLAKRGVTRLDRLVLSHGDNDHVGGFGHLLEALAVADVSSGEPARVGGPARRCTAGEAWQWDGVSFEFLHPAPTDTYRGNDASCVLRVANAAGAVLLTGDIEARVERQLVERHAAGLRSRVVIAPHHGSRSSSSTALVAATRPDYVVYARGWANRYGFPAAAVQARWRAAAAAALDTASAGTIGFYFSAARGMAAPTRHRVAERRFWWHAPGSAAEHHAVSSADRRAGVVADDPDLEVSQKCSNSCKPVAG
jgi:competence protein ComEC